MKDNAHTAHPHHFFPFITIQHLVAEPVAKRRPFFVICLQVVVKLVSGEVCDVRVARLELRRIDCRLYLSLSDKGDLVSWRGK